MQHTPGVGLLVPGLGMAFAGAPGGLRPLSKEPVVSTGDGRAAAERVNGLLAHPKLFGPCRSVSVSLRRD